MRSNAVLAACSAVLLATAGCSGGLDLTICGTAEWDATSRGADTTTNRTVTVDFTTEKRFAEATKLFDSVELATATVEVVSIGEGNTSTKVSGKVEVGPEDGSQKVLIAQFTDLAVTADAKLELVLSAEGKALAQELLKGGSHKFKAYISGAIDKAPASVKLRAKFNVVAKVSGGGTKTDLGCVSFGVISDEPAPSCDPNPCLNGGTCAATAEALVCTCAQGLSGVKCETSVSGDLCANVTCEGAQACNPATGQCEGNGDLCANVTCEGTQTCNPATGLCEGATGNTPPTASILGPTQVLAGREFTLDGSNSADSDGSIAAYAWDFGDGTNASTAQVTKTFSTPGAYTVTLVVTDDDGATGTAQINIGAAPDCTLSGCPGPLECNAVTGLCEQSMDACAMCRCQPGGQCFAQCASTSFCGGEPGPSGEGCFLCSMQSCGEACNN